MRFYFLNLKLLVLDIPITFSNSHSWPFSWYTNISGWHTHVLAKTSLLRDADADLNLYCLKYGSMLHIVIRSPITSTSSRMTRINSFPQMASKPCWLHVGDHIMVTALSLFLFDSAFSLIKACAVLTSWESGLYKTKLHFSTFLPLPWSLYLFIPHWYLVKTRLATFYNLNFIMTDRIISEFLGSLYLIIFKSMDSGVSLPA